MPSGSRAGVTERHRPRLEPRDVGARLAWPGLLPAHRPELAGGRPVDGEEARAALRGGFLAATSVTP